MAKVMSARRQLTLYRVSALARSLMLVIVLWLPSLAVSAKLGEQLKRGKGCGWNQYYDDNMKNCGPCREQCLHMDQLGSHALCRQQCADYLRSLNCTYDQYYDDNVQSCAQCLELCTLADLKGTTADCSNKCWVYLRAVNCTDSEFFQEESKKCQPCSALCGDGKISSDCQKKCKKYLDKHHPDMHQVPPRQGKVEGLPHQSSPGSASDPGSMVTVVVAILLGLFIFAALVGSSIYWYRRRSRLKGNGDYAKASNQDTDIPADQDNVERPGDADTRREPELKKPVQVSSTDMAGVAPSSVSAEAESGEGGTTGRDSGVSVGIAECDPLGPSSAAHSHVSRNNTEMTSVFTQSG